MSKTLIFADTIDRYICSQSNTLTMDATKILTPGARDALSARKVQIIYAPQSKGAEELFPAPTTAYTPAVAYAQETVVTPLSPTEPCHICATFADIFGEEKNTGQGPCFVSSISKEFGWNICKGASCKKHKKPL